MTLAISTFLPRLHDWAFGIFCLEAMSRIWAAELDTKLNITSNCVNPGPVATDMFNYVDPESREYISTVQNSPMRELRT